MAKYKPQSPDGYKPQTYGAEGGGEEETATASASPTLGLSPLSEPSGRRKDYDQENIIAEDAMLIEFVAQFLKSIESKAA